MNTASDRIRNGLFAPERPPAQEGAAQRSRLQSMQGITRTIFTFVEPEPGAAYPALPSG